MKTFVRIRQSLGAASLAALLAACGGGGSSTPASDGVSAEARTVTGAVMKGPLQGATVQFFLVDELTGAVSTTALSGITATVNNGGFSVSGLPNALVAAVATGGFYVDESDPDTANARKIAMTGPLTALLPANASTFAITPLSMALFQKAQVEYAAQTTTSHGFGTIYSATRFQAQQVYGFDPVTTVPASPSNGTGGNVAYGLLLGGVAQAINALAVNARHFPAFGDVQAFINDYSDGKLDGTCPSGLTPCAAGGVNFNDEIRRFRGNNDAVYSASGTSAPTVNEQALSAPPAVSNAQPTIDALSRTDFTFNQTQSVGLQTISLSGITPGANEAGQTLTVTLSSTNPLLTPNLALNYTPGSSTGSVTFTPDTSAVGSALVTITVRDNGGTANGGSDTTTRTFGVTIAAFNNAPTITDLTDLATDEDTSTAALAFTVGDVETPAASLNVSASSNDVLLVPSLVLGGSGANRTLTLAPGANLSGSATITVTVTDGGGASTSDTFVLTVNPVNDAPVAVDDNASVAEDTLLSIAASTLLANDTDIDGPALSLTAVGNAVGGVVAINGANVEFTPAANFTGAASFDYTVSDGALTDTGTVAITVAGSNDAPTISDVVDQVIAEDSSTGALAFTIGDPETAASALTVAAGSSNLALVPNAGIVLGGSGASRTLTVTPAANASGTATITITVSDGVATSSDTFVLTVTPVNDAPLAVDDSGFTTLEDTALGIPAATLLANDSDIDGPAPTITGVSGAQNGTVTLAGGTVTFTPATDYNGPAQFDYTISDGSATDVGTVFLTVTASNDAPTIGTVSAQTIAEDSSTGALAFTVADAETAAGSLVVTASSSNTALVASGNILLGGSGGSRTIAVSPVPNGNGSTTITLTVSDGTATASSSFLLTVTAVNDPPVAVNDSGFSTAEDTALTIPAATLAANDSDIDGTTPSVTAVSNPQNGTVSLSAGTVTFTPSANYNGAAQFDYTISDGTATATATVSLTVVAANDAPVITGQSALSTAEETGLALVPANFTISDPDSSSFTLSVGAGANYSVTGTTVTPALNFTGVLTVPVTVSDGSASSNTFNASITVTAVNDAPAITGQVALSTAEETGLTLSVANFTVSDPDSASFTLAVAPGANYSVTGTTVTPAANFNGTLSVPVTVNDGTANSAPFSASITVTPVNDAPSAANDSYVAKQGGTLTVLAGGLPAGLLFNDSDVDAGAGELVVSATPVSAPAHAASLVLNADGGFSYTHDGTAATSDSFSYEVCDNPATPQVALCATATVNLTITAATANVTRLVSFAAGAPATTGDEGNGATSLFVAQVNKQLSRDGRYLAFVSSAKNLVAGQADTAGTPDVFLFDRATGITTLVSRSTGGATVAGNSGSDGPVISDDGRYVAFESAASDLVAGDTNGVVDVFVFDRDTGTVSLVSHASSGPTTAATGGDSLSPVMSGDGRFIAFRSKGTNIVAGQTEGNANFDMFLYDRLDGSNVLVSQAAGGAVNQTGNGRSASGELSRDGRYVVYLSFANDLVPGRADNNGVQDVILFDRLSGENRLVSRNYWYDFQAANGASSFPAISADGRTIAFVSEGTDLGLFDNNGAPDVYSFDTVFGTVGLISHLPGDSFTAANAESNFPVMSADGRRVAYLSYATDIGGNKVSGPAAGDLYLWDSATDTNTLVSHAVGDPSTTANGDAGNPLLTADGSIIVYTSNAADITSDSDTNGAYDTFVYDVASGTSRLVSRSSANPGATGIGGDSYPGAFSADGSSIVMISAGTDLVPGQVDSNASTDVFVWFGPGTSADFDGDGLSNYEESQVGTNVWLADSDGDGLSDSYEINVSFTDPLNADSDGDGALDGADPASGIFANYAPALTSVPTDPYSVSINRVSGVGPLQVGDVNDPQGTGSYTVTLSLAGQGVDGVDGTLNVRTDVPYGLTSGEVSGNGTASVTIVAPLSLINTTFASLGATGEFDGVSYVPSGTFSGQQQLTVAVTDGGSQTQSGSVVLGVNRLDLDESQPDIARINGVLHGDKMGQRVIGGNGGDFDNDGEPDLVVSTAFGPSPAGRQNAGMVNMLFGNRTNAGFQTPVNPAGHEPFELGSDLDTVSASATNGVTFLGADGAPTPDDVGDRAGASYTLNGDLDGDGVSDLLIAAERAKNDAGLRRGRIYAIFGGQTYQASMDLSVAGLGGVRSVIFDGKATNAAGTLSNQLGRALEYIGDVNRDGYQDIFIGAPGLDTTNGDDSGGGYVVFGGPALGACGNPCRVDLESLTSVQGFKVIGAQAGDLTGYTAGRLGDFNGDGIDDFAVSSILASPDAGRPAAGQTYVIYGRAGSFPPVVSLGSLSGVGMTFNGPEANEGMSVAGVGDTNGDGLGDLLIGTTSFSGNGVAHGGAGYLVYGAPGLPLTQELGSLSSPYGYKLYGGQAEGGTGFRVRGVGDVNRDGLADFAISSGDSPVGRPGAGTGYLLYGRLDTPIAPLALGALDGRDGIALVGLRAGDVVDSFGGLGDVDNNGVDDLVVSAHAADRIPAEEGTEGAAYVVYRSSFRPVDDADNDGLSAAYEAVLGTDPNNADSDGDGLDDHLEAVVLRTDPMNADTDGDGVNDNVEIQNGDPHKYEPQLGDTDPHSATTNNAPATFSAVPLGYASVGMTGRTPLPGYAISDADSPVSPLYELTLSLSPGVGESQTVGGMEIKTDVPSGITGPDLQTPNGVSFVIVRASMNAINATLADPDGVSYVASSIPYSGHQQLVVTVRDLGPAGPGSTATPFYQQLSVDRFELADTASNHVTRFNGAGDGDVTGFRVGASGGDFDGDGLTDLVIGAPQDQSTFGTVGTGKVYLLFGGTLPAPPAGGVDLYLADVPFGSPGVEIDGEAFGDQFGITVALDGDMDRDGYADLVVGAAKATVPGSGGGQRAGRAYVIFGGQSLPNPLDLANPPAGLRMLVLDGVSGDASISTPDRTGRVAYAGDINRDGYADVLVGAPTANPAGRVDAGAVYVVFGGPGASLTPASCGGPCHLGLGTLNGTNGFTVIGATDPDANGSTDLASAMGFTLGRVGDFNGDAIDDFVTAAGGVDALGRLDAGAGYVIFGRTDGFPATIDTDNLGNNGLVFYGAAAGDGLGPVDGIGDFNGDGRGDIAFGLNLTQGGAYVVYGGPSYITSFDLADLQTPNANGFLLATIGPNDGGGGRLHRIGDINRDGIDDLAMIGCQTDAGGVCVLFGSTTKYQSPFDSTQIDGVNGFAVHGVAAGDATGDGLGYVGDINGDGYDDLIVGNQVANNAAGVVSLIYGANFHRIVDADGDGLSAEYEQLLGTSDGMLDTDGDGLSDALEVRVLHTDGTTSDTDGDGADDNVEIQNGDPYRYDPHLGDSDPRDYYSVPGGSGNSAPTANDDSYNVSGGYLFVPAVSGVLANDSDPGDTLSASVLSFALPQHGSVNLDADGRFSYLHDGSLTTTDSFMYQACDNHSPSLCGTATVSLTIDLQPEQVLLGNWQFLDFGSPATSGHNGNPDITYRDTSLTFLPGGKYVLGQYVEIPSAGGADAGINSSDATGSVVAGIEYGGYTWDSGSGGFAVDRPLTIETDGFGGFNEPPVNSTNDVRKLFISPDGNTLTFEYDDTPTPSVARYTRAPSVPGSLTGAFLVDGSLLDNEPKVFTFMPTDATHGRYIMADANRFEGQASSENAGIEVGCFEIDVNGHWSTYTAVGPNCSYPYVIDTNGDAGIGGTTSAVGMSFSVVDDDTIRITVDADNFTGTATRLPVTSDHPQVSLIGSWEVLEEDHSKNVILTFLADGRYIKGGLQNDPNCGSADPDGNGYELGTWSFASGTLSTTVTENHDGDCGLGSGSMAITLSGDGQSFTVDGAPGVSVHRLASNAGNSLIGTWHFAGVQGPGTPEDIALQAHPTLLHFKADGRFYLTDTDPDNTCGDNGDGGVETAGYVYDSGAGTLVLDQFGPDANGTDGGCGLSDFAGQTLGVTFNSSTQFTLATTGGNFVFTRLSGVNPVDGDADGLTYSEEAAFGSNPSAADADGDGLDDSAEYRYSTSPNNADTDGDGASDGYEVAQGTDPNDAASVPATAQIPQDDFYAVAPNGTLNVPAPGVLANDNLTDGSGLSVDVFSPISGLSVTGNGSFSYTAGGSTGEVTFTYTVRDGSNNTFGPATVHINVTSNTASSTPVFTFEPYHVQSSQGGGDYLVRTSDFAKATLTPHSSGTPLAWAPRISGKVVFNGDTSINRFFADRLIYVHNGQFYYTGLRDIDSPSLPQRFSAESSATYATVCTDDRTRAFPLAYDKAASREAWYTYVIKGSGACGTATDTLKAAKTSDSTSTSPVTVGGSIVEAIYDNTDPAVSLKGFFLHAADGSLDLLDASFGLAQNDVLGVGAGIVSARAFNDIGGKKLFETYDGSGEHVLRMLSLNFGGSLSGNQTVVQDISATLGAGYEVKYSKHDATYHYVVETLQSPLTSKIFRIPLDGSAQAVELYSIAGAYIENLEMTDNLLVFNTRQDNVFTNPGALRGVTKTTPVTQHVFTSQHNNNPFYTAGTNVYYAERSAGGVYHAFVKAENEGVVLDAGSNTTWVGKVLQDTGTLNPLAIGESASHVFLATNYSDQGIKLSYLKYVNTAGPLSPAPGAGLGPFDSSTDTNRYAFFELDQPGRGLGEACVYPTFVPVKECDMFAVDVTTDRFQRITQTSGLNEGRVEDDSAFADE